MRGFCLLGCDVPNLFICDGSVLPTQGSANPTITISAMAVRTAHRLRENAGVAAAPACTSVAAAVCAHLEAPETRAPTSAG